MNARADLPSALVRSVAALLALVVVLDDHPLPDRLVVPVLAYQGLAGYRRHPSPKFPELMLAATLSCMPAT